MYKQSTNAEEQLGQMRLSIEDLLCGAGEVRLGAVAGAIYASRTTSKPSEEKARTTLFPSESD